MIDPKCKTREQAIEALEGCVYECNISDILDKIWPPEQPTTNADAPPDTDAPGPPTKP